jgi:glycosyltransferase involved in cell wall biosynthesis
MCTKLIVMSQEDKEYITSKIDHAKKIEVVSNGVDADWFAQKPKKLPKDPTILSVGTFKWLPNVEAVTFLAEKVWPLIKKQIPDAKLWIVGNAPTKRVFEYQQQDTSITVTGGIPDIRDAFNGGHVLVAPVFSGKGTRYKILEAMACQTPIVATTTAVEGLGVEHGVHVLISNSAAGLAKNTIKLLKDKKLRLWLAYNSRKFVKRYYDWQTISQKLDKVYRSLQT